MLEIHRIMLGSGGLVLAFFQHAQIRLE